ncbi:MAG TPA: SxtJ family membrane protein [Bryobacteraceae bacterium]|nr:SxtJ family membrane protein [Bryobacteraceae bacterium]
MSTHEDFTRKEEHKGPSDRSFGWVFVAFFALVGLWPMIWGRPMRPWALGLSAAIALITILRPGILHPFNRVWMAFGLLLARVTNPIVMALLFYLVFTPMALLLRLAGKDLLRLRREPQAASYWIERTPPGPKPETMAQQF